MNPSPQPRTGKASLLIVDDEKSIRRTLGEFLLAEGHAVTEAPDADTALLHLAAGNFDIVVTDIILPRLSGVELLRRIHAAAPQVHVIMMTGEPTVETAAESLRGGAMDYLLKPVTKTAIIRAVEQVLRIRALERERQRLEDENRAHQANLERLVHERTAQLRASEELARELSSFNQSVLDALTAHVCVLAEDGTILAVNRPWHEFAAANAPAPVPAEVGDNYFAACTATIGPDAPVAAKALQGLREVARGLIPEFSLEYPCHSPDTQKWFTLRATRFAERQLVRIVVTHEDVSERKLATLELQHSHELYRGAIVAANAIPYQKDHQSDRYVFMGSGIKDLLGYAPEELSSPFWTSITLETVFLGEAAGLPVVEAGRQLIAGRIKNWRADHRVRTRNGDIRWISDSAVPLRAADGRFLGSLGIIQDITERKQAEQALRESEKRFRSLYENTLMGLYRAAPDGRILLANPALLRMLGFNAFADLVRQNPRLHGFHPHYPTDLLKREGAVQGLEAVWTRADGTPVFVRESVRALRDEAGNILYYDGVVEDITAQKQAEDQLRKLARAVEQSPASIVITDRDGNIEFVNPKFTEIAGYAPEEVLGKNPRILKSGETPAEVYQQLWETITAGDEWRGEFRNKRKDGTLYWETASISPVRDAQDRISHFIAVKEDVTEKKQLQAELLRTQRLEGIGRLASGVAHDLNNILAPMLMVPAVLREVVSDPANRQLLDLMESSAKRGADIVKQLLTFGRGADSLRSQVSLRHLIRDMAAIIGETFPKNIKLQRQTPRDAWLVEGDPTQLHQVLLNLCLNARDAMPDGGMLTIALEHHELHGASADLPSDLPPGRYICLSVTDTGVGIAPEIIGRIWDPFFTAKERGKGTGLGLYTVSTIVQSHAGFIRVASQPGRGTQFKVYLPATASTDADTEAGSATPSPQGRGELVLLVEDEEGVRRATRQVLEANGYRVVEAGDGLAGMSLYMSHQLEVKLVLTDLDMPNMDGLSIIRSLRQVNPRIPIVTASGHYSAVSGLSDLGVPDDFRLTKPFSSAVLLQVLQFALEPGAAGRAR